MLIFLGEELDGLVAETFELVFHEVNEAVEKPQELNSR